MGFGFRVAKGVTVYPSSRGISFGAGNVRYYHRMRGARGSSRRSSGLSVAERQRQAREAERLEEIQRLAELDLELARFCEVHKEDFPESTRPIAPEPAPVDERSLRKQLEKQAVTGIPIFKFADRRRAKALVRERLPEELEAEQRRRRAAHDAEQAEMDAEWDRLISNDPDTVVGVLEAAFEDNEVPATPIGCDGGRADVLMRWPQVSEVVPERKAAVTPTGRPTIHKRKKAEINGTYLNALCSHALVTVKEAFAVCPALETVGLVVLRDRTDLAQGDVIAEVLLIGTLEKRDFDGVIWENVVAAPGLLEKLHGRIGLKGKGSRPDLFGIQLSDDEESLGSIRRVAGSLGWRLSPGDVPGVATPLKVEVSQVQ